MQSAKDYRERIVIDPKVHFGKPCVAGTLLLTQSRSGWRRWLGPATPSRISLSLVAGLKRSAGSCPSCTRSSPFLLVPTLAMRIISFSRPHWTWGFRGWWRIWRF